MKHLPARRAHLSPEQRALEAAALLQRGKRIHMAKAVLNGRIPRYLQMEPGGVFLGPAMCGSGPRVNSNRRPITLAVERVTCRACNKRIRNRRARFKPWRKLTPELEREILDLRVLGRGPATIARVLGVSPFLVRQVLVEHHGTHSIDPNTSLLARASDALAKMDVPLLQTHRIAAAMWAASLDGEEQLMRMFKHLCDTEGVKSWDYPSWWRERSAL